MKLCVIEAGLTPEPLRPAFGRYATMIEDWIAPYLPEARFSAITVVDDEPLPDDPPWAPIPAKDTTDYGGGVWWSGG